MTKRTPLLLAAIFFVAASSIAQGLKKIPVGKSGCAMYIYCDIYLFDESKSPDSSVVYTGECTNDDVIYGTICVKLISPRNNLDKAEELLTAYLNFLKTSFKITRAAGYGKGHRLNNNENTRGLLDYWEDTEKRNWKVKGWTDGKFIGVMYAYSRKELPEQKVNIFLDGFRLPEVK